MRRLHPRPILLLGFGSIIALVIAAMAISTHNLSILTGQVEAIVGNHNVRIQLSTRMLNSSRERAALLHRMLLEDDPFRRDALYMRMRDLGERFIKARERLAQMGVDGVEQQFLDQQSQFSQRAGPLQHEVYEALTAGERDLAVELFIDRTIPLQNRALEALESFIELQQQRNEQALQRVSARSRDVQRLIAVLSLAVALLTFGIGASLWHRLRNTIRQLEDSEQELSTINRQLQSSESRERAIRENAVDAIITIDAEGIIRSWNRAAEHMFGYSKSEALGRNINMIVPEPHGHRHNDYLRNYLDTGEARIIGIGREVEGQCRDGRLLPLYLGVTEVIHQGEHTFIGVLRDISEQKRHEQALRQARDELEQRVVERTEALQQANSDLHKEVEKHKHTQEQLRYLANYDALTELPNRTLYSDHLRITLAQARRRGQEVALLYLDLDGFKAINDNHGHDAGDQVLREVANRLLSILREADMVARIGGDEFTVVLGPESGIEAVATHVADKILAVIELPFQIRDREHRLGASIGISLYPRDAEDLEAIQKHADAAMYRAKHSGKHRYCMHAS